MSLEPIPGLTPPQQEVLERGLLDAGFNCVLQMPTGSGKTWLARRATAETVASGYRAVYLCPTRALASELYARWRAEYEDVRVGIFTGDYGIAARPYPVDFGDAQVLLMTPERFDACTRNWRSHWHWLPEVDLLVVDEFHLLGDGLRGARLEGALSRFRRLNPFARLACLSATLGNRAELADWLDGVDYFSTWRSIPLEWKIARFRKAEEKPAILTREVTRTVRRGGRSLVFAQSRRRAEFLADLLRVNDLRAEHHHAGLNHDERADVEARFRDGSLDVLVSTATLEVGLNLPARQVVLYDLQEFDGSDFKPLRTVSVWQRVGRAGRFGLDDRGEAVLIAPSWDKTCDRYVRGAFESVSSQLGNRACLNEQILVELTSGLARNRTELRRVLAGSLAAMQTRLPDVQASVEDMLAAEMLREDSRAEGDEREVRLRATRLGRVAVRHMLEPQTVQTIRAELGRIGTPTFFDLALTLACTNDCEPVLPANFEDLESLAGELRGVRSMVLSGGMNGLRLAAGISRRRALAAIKMASVVLAWTRSGDARLVSDSLNCYPYEVHRLAESMARLLSATSDLLQPPRCTLDEPEAPVDDPMHLARKRAQLLTVMVSHALDGPTASLTLVRGLGPAWARRLRDHGIGDVEELAQLDPADLRAVKGLSQRRAAEWIDRANRIIKEDDLWVSMDFGPMPSFESGVADWPSQVDPYRLRRSLQLTVAASGIGYLVSGGLDPHRVQLNAGAWSCDCIDYNKGHLCKHILAVRLAAGDAVIASARAKLLDAQESDTDSLSSLWMAEEPRHVYASQPANTEDAKRRPRLSGLHTRDDIREEVPAG